MARKKPEPSKKLQNPNVEGLHAEVLEQPICCLLYTSFHVYNKSQV